MEDETTIVERARETLENAPDRRMETLDVADLPPPQPLTATLERAEEIDDAVILQLNDRAPQHLYPKLDDRGFTWETVELEDVVLTAIWQE